MNMSPQCSISEAKFSQPGHKNMSISLDQKIISTTIHKPLVLTVLFLFLFCMFLPNIRHTKLYQQRYTLLQSIENADPPVSADENTSTDSNPTNISHIVVAISSTLKTLRLRKPSIESWWRPNVTKGYIFLDREPKSFLPWAPTSPPYRIYEDTSRYKPYNKHPMRDAIRMVRVVLEAFREAHEGVRWYVMTDDDTVLFLDNLVEILSKYDHTKYFYVGETSESVQSNIDNSFEMGFGGGGYAISYPLAEALVESLDVCIKRYPNLYGSDHMMQSCVADLGVSLTHEKGFHQIDLHKDLSGFLSSLPQTPLVSLHHLEAVNPLFPSMNRLDSLNHLMKAAKFDQSRLLQQTICYQRLKNLSFSIAWGYSAQVYEQIIPPSVLKKPLKTFSAWGKDSKMSFMFNTRRISNNSCEMPHDFFLEHVGKFDEEDRIFTSRRRSRRMPNCSLNKVSSALASDIARIIVVSPATKYSAMGGSRRECCDVEMEQVQKNVSIVKLRACMANELTGVD